MKKYRLTDEKIIVGCKTLYRIQALKDFECVKKGDLGGYIESEKNLSHDGDARVYDNALVCDNADIKNKSDICSIGGFGSEFRTTTAFKTKDGSIHVSCGCFYGNLDEFYNRVEEMHGDTSHGREYKKIIELIKIHFGIE